MSLLRPLLALTFIVFCWSIAFPFIALDDAKHIWQNPYVLHFSIDNLLQFWKAPYYGLYVPVVYNFWAFLAWLTQLMNLKNETTSLAAPLFHFTNVMLHVFNTYLCFQFTKLIMAKWRSSLILKDSFSDEKLSLLVILATLPFALHPLQVESVAWASGLKDVLSTTLGLVALLSWSSWNSWSVEATHSRKNKKVAKTFFWENSAPIIFYLAFTLAFLTKPNTVVLPLIILFLSWMFSPAQIARVTRRLLPVFAISLWVIIKTKQSQPDMRLEFTLQLFERPFVAAASIGFYFAKFLAPWPLSPDYGLTPVKLLHHDLVIVLYTVFLLFSALLAFALKKGTRLFALGSAMVLIGYLPVLGLIPFEFQNLSTVADRYFYFLPSMGLGIILANFFFRISEKPLKMSLATMALIWSALSFFQLSHWRNNEALFQQTLSTNADSYLSLNNLGLQAIRSGDFSSAEKWLKRALEVKPEYLAAVANLGVVYFKQQNYNRAIEFYTQALEKLPPAGAGSPATFADMHFNLGAALLNTGQVALGQKNIETAIVINPDHFLAHYHLGRIYVAQKNLDQAKKQFLEALRLQPNDANVISELNRLPH